MQSLIYSQPQVYRWLMRCLYGRYFAARYQAIDAEIPIGVSVVDVCAGDGYLYSKFLCLKQVRYLGLDVSAQMVNWAQRRGVPMQVSNIWQADIPHADIVVMQASLYQFIPQADLILHKMLRAAYDKVIVSEPIRNLASSSNRLFAYAGRYLTVPSKSKESYHGQRFNEQSLFQLFKSFESFKQMRLLPGGREALGVFAGQAIEAAA